MSVVRSVVFANVNGGRMTTRIWNMPSRKLKIGKMGTPVSRASTAGPMGSGQGRPHTLTTTVRPPARGRSPWSATMSPFLSAWARVNESVGYVPLKWAT